MVSRIRDVATAEEIAAQAGTDETPELVLSDTLVPVIFAPQRPPLFASGYFPGTISANSAAAASNTSHVGIFGNGRARGIIRVNWLRIFNDENAIRFYSLTKVNTPSGFTQVRASPVYVDAAPDATGIVFSLVRNDTVGRQGILIAQDLPVPALGTLQIDGPWILNSGAIMISNGTVNKACRVAYGYEAWNAIRDQ